MTRNSTHSSSDINSPYHFWLPPEDRFVMVGPQQDEILLPLVPLPIKQTGDVDQAAPSDNLIGTSVYEYLRRYPDCQYCREYAELLRDGYPHFITDLASQIVMLSHKDVAAAYLQRLVNYLKILLLLDPQNLGLKQQLGLIYYRLAMNFEVLSHCRSNLLAAQHYLLAACSNAEYDLATANHLAQIAYLFADYPFARELWEQLQASLTDVAALEQIKCSLEKLQSGRLPQQPLIDELEKTGEAMLLYGSGKVEEAKIMLETIEEQGALCRDQPLAEFHYLLGICRLNCDEPAGAFDSFSNALQIDPEFKPALEAQEALLTPGG